MKYRVNYYTKTHSRYGTYIYKEHEIVEASNEEEAKKIVTEKWGRFENNGHHKMVITGVREIA